jgi:predicted NBD/HSP70 family sugar kinase
MENLHVTSNSGREIGTPAHMRALNQRLILSRLSEHGEASRPQLAAATGLSKPTVGQALADLEAQGLVRPAGMGPSKPGRAPVVYEIVSDAGHVVGIDIGRQQIRVAVADLAGRIAARIDEPNRCRSGSALLRTVLACAERCVAKAGVAAEDVVVTVVGTPGVPDLEDGTVRRAPNLPGWERRGLLHELIAGLDQSGSIVMIENDANLCAAGEHAAGAAVGVDTFACLTVGTGLGMGFVLDGQIYRGTRGAAGEISDLAFKVSGTPGPASAEAAVAGQAVVAAAHDAGLTDVRSAKAVFELARSGDPVALEVVAQETIRLAFVVSAIIAILDPSLIILAGGIGSNADLLAAPIRTALAATTPVIPEIVAGQLGEDAVLTGAIAAGLATAQELIFDRRATNQ